MADQIIFYTGGLVGKVSIYGLMDDRGLMELVVCRRYIKLFKCTIKNISD